MTIFATSLALTFGLAIGYIIGRARLEEAKQDQYQQGRTDEFQRHEDARAREQQIKNQHTIQKIEQKIAKLEAQHRNQQHD